MSADPELAASYAAVPDPGTRQHMILGYGIWLGHPAATEMTGLLAAQPFDSRIFGDESLARRPMDRIMKPLAQMGARIEARRALGAALEERAGFEALAVGDPRAEHESRRNHPTAVTEPGRQVGGQHDRDTARRQQGHHPAQKRCQQRGSEQHFTHDGSPWWTVRASIPLSVWFALTIYVIRT